MLRGTLLALVLATAGLALSACGDDDGNPQTYDAAPDVIDAGPGGSALERPPVLPRPPAGGLPDELRPPR
jgi:hypothetical protein